MVDGYCPEHIIEDGSNELTELARCTPDEAHMMGEYMRYNDRYYSY